MGHSVAPEVARGNPALRGPILLRQWERGRRAALKTMGLIAMVTGATLLAGAADAQTEVDARIAFVVLGPDQAAVARVITTDATCPSILLDGQARPMAIRAAPSGPDFPVLVCEAPIPQGTQRAAIGGQLLPLRPRATPQRVVAIGDTGCRLKIGHPFQACNDPAAWPFAAISQAAADWRPDVVINTGDYLYRELACPAGNAGCAGSPFGDNWAAWYTDFFQPALPLLGAAPWVMARGDHEACGRGAGGFFRFLDPRPMPLTCPKSTDPYAVTLGELRLAIVDTSDAANTSQSRIEKYTREFGVVEKLAADETWLVMHMPLFALRPANPGPSQHVEEITPSLQKASGNRTPAGVTQVLSGHIHLFQALGFADRRSPQLVVGTGGTLLDPDIVAALTGRAIGGTTVAGGRAAARFGFTSLEPAGPPRTWAAALRDRRGVAQLSCTLTPSASRCAE